MFILTLGVRHMVLPFIEVDFGHPTLLTKAVDEPARHFDRPYPIIRPVVMNKGPSSHRDTQRVWRRLEKPLSHFLVSFVPQELVFSSEVLAAAPGALEKFESAGLPVERVWIRGEYA